jgi:hypothetical protein
MPDRAEHLQMATGGPLPLREGPAVVRGLYRRRAWLSVIVTQSLVCRLPGGSPDGVILAEADTAASPRGHLTTVLQPAGGQEARPRTDQDLI